MTIDPEKAGINRDVVIQKLENNNIEARPTWNPVHLQPLYKDCQSIGGTVAEEIFRTGVCLPSGTGMSDDDLQRVMSVVRGCWS